MSNPTPSASVTVNFTGVPKRAAAPAKVERVWSAQQVAVFDWGAARQPGTALLVRARAGTGKTTTIVELVQRVSERKVLLAAFNKSIARELQSRVGEGRIECKTLHGLGLRFIKYAWGKQVQAEEDGDKGKRALALAKAAMPDADEGMQKLCARLHTKTRELEPAAKGEDVEAIAWRYDMVPEAQEMLGDLVRGVLRAMELASRRTDVVDFADMIFLPCRHNMPRPWYEMVVVDEAQDMTKPQLWIAQRACKAQGRMVIVGDDRQAIYGFRGADSGSLDRLKEELRATELPLTETYRCGRGIVKLAQEIVPDFVGKTTWDGEIVKRDEDAMLEEAAAGDFILSRVNAPLVTICMTLLKRGVRARVKGRDIGKGIVALVRKLRASSVDELKTKLAARTAKELAAAASIGDEDARAAREQFVRDQEGIVLALAQTAAVVEDVVRKCEELFTDDDTAGAVTCSSVHKAKGLEAERVYLLAGTFRSGKLEEDNLRYVAITRAKRTLAWVSGYGKDAK